MEPLVPGYYYHIYNHANGNEELFLEEKNYDYFLEKIKEHILPVADFYAYCLMPNHFHFLVKIKDDAEIQMLESFPKFQTLEKLESLEKVEQITSNFISKQFSNLFSSYTEALNRMYNRKGSLFLKNFKRKKIQDEKYFIRLVNYIHFNPVQDGFVNKPSEWRYSSFNAIVSNKQTLVKRDDVLEWFDGLTNVLYNHLRPLDI